MDVLTNLIDGACETLTARYEEYKRGNDGSGEGFDSTSAIYLTADGESRGLSADERLALLAENPGWLCRDHEELPGRSGLVTISINDLLHDILVEHLVDALGSHYSSLQGEERDRERALLPEWVRTAYKALWEVEADYIPTEATEVIGHLIAARTALLAGTGVEPWELPS
jgi:hypothetical protein